jgi:hypothetical protein
MDLIVIGLIVLIFLVLYGLYWFLKSAALTKGIVSLNTAQTTESEKLDVAGSDIYYDGWIFIVNTTSASTLINRELQIVVDTSVANKSTMSIKTHDGTINVTTVTDDLPLQKWVHFAVRYRSSILEIYLNGKLIKTTHYSRLMHGYDKTKELTIGSTGTINGYITKVRRLTNPLDSNRIWESYLEGNGQFSGTMGYLFNFFDDYNAKVTIYKNDIKQRDMSLFNM